MTSVTISQRRGKSDSGLLYRFVGFGYEVRKGGLLSLTRGSVVWSNLPEVQE